MREGGISMVRSAGVRILVISVLAASMGFAQSPNAGPQNSDLSFLAGPVFGSTQGVLATGETVKVTGYFSFQSDFAHTIHSYSFGDLWYEFPSTYASRDSASVGGASNSYSEYFVTPGVRLHVPVGSRVSFYGAAGGGYGNFNTTLEYVSPGAVSQHNSNWHGAFDFGGGVDFRLTRLLSLRGEIRDFVTGRGLGGVDGRNHLLTLFGVAVHF
jgi:opacity protein-like surface antigen